MTVEIFAHCGCRYAHTEWHSVFTNKRKAYTCSGRSTILAKETKLEFGNLKTALFAGIKFHSCRGKVTFPE